MLKRLTILLFFVTIFILPYRPEPSFSEYAPELQELWTPQKIIGMCLATAMVLSVLFRKVDPRTNVLHSLYWLVCFKFISTAGASILGYPIQFRAFLTWGQGLVLLWIAAALIDDDKMLNRTLWVLVLSNIITGVFAIYNYINLRAEYEAIGSSVAVRMGIGSNYGAFGASGYSYMLTMHLPIAVYLASRSFSIRCSWFHRFFLLANVVMTMINLILTLQRSSYAVAALMLFFLLFLIFKQYKQRFYLKGLIAAFVALGSITGIIIVGNIWGKIILDRFSLLWQVFTTGDISSDYAIWGRIQMQKAAIDVFSESPIFGIGHGNFQAFSAQLVPVIGTAGSAENSYLQILAENGFGYLIVYLIWYGYWLRWNRLRANPQEIIHSVLAISVWAGLLLSLTAWIEADPWFLLYTGLMLSYGVSSISRKTNTQCRKSDFAQLKEIAHENRD